MLSSILLAWGQEALPARGGVADQSARLARLQLPEATVKGAAVDPLSSLMFLLSLSRFLRFDRQPREAGDGGRILDDNELADNEG